jgi:hypothetical protein
MKSGARGGWAVSTMPRPVHLQESDPVGLHGNEKSCPHPKKKELSKSSLISDIAGERWTPRYFAVFRLNLNVW